MVIQSAIQFGAVIIIHAVVAVAAIGLMAAVHRGARFVAKAVRS